MAIPVLILGESGSGKTYSIKNFDTEKVGIFCVEKNFLPFQKPFHIAKNATYEMIMKSLSAPKLKTYIIDDSQYLLVNEFFDKAKEKGFEKFTDIAKNFRDLIHFINTKVPDDVTVYFLHHSEYDSNSGRKKAKTVGKMLDDKLTVEGCFNIVLFTEIVDGKYYFTTQSDGFNTAKSPEGLLDKQMPNDLKIVDDKIRKYYQIGA